MKKLMLVVVGAILGLSALAESFYTRNYKSSTCVWRDFDNWENWGIWSDGETGENPDHLVPGENDWINAGNVEWGNAYNWFDLKGKTYTIKGIEGGYDDGQVHNRWWYLTNGTLVATSTWSNRSVRVTQYAGSKLIWAETSHTMLGINGQEITHVIKEGGELQILGTLEQCRGRFEINAGGKLVLDPVFFGGETNTFGNGFRPAFVNEGLVTMPHGLTFQGSGPDYDGYQMFIQTNGTLEVGGPIVHASSRARFNMEFYGGTIHATAPFSFSSTKNPGLTEFKFCKNAAVTINVDETASFDFKNAKFGDNVVLTKQGKGLVKFDAELPSSVVVDSGAEYPVAAKTALGSYLTLAPNSTLVLNGLGVTANAIAGLEDESVAVKVGAVSTADFVFLSDDDSLLETVAAKLTASSAERGAFTVINGGVFFEPAHEATVFSWKKEIGDASWHSSASTVEAVPTRTHSNYLDPASWAVGRGMSGTNPDGLIPSSADSIYISDSYEPLFAMDMGGAARSLVNYDKTGYTDKWGFNGFAVRNGSLTFTGSFKTTRGFFIPHDGGKIVLSETSDLHLGSGGAQAYAYVLEGGELEFLGSVSIDSGFYAYIYEGGTFTLDPVDGCLNQAGAYAGRVIENSGALNLPHGFTLTGSGHTDIRFELTQKTGTLTLGGSIVRNGNQPYGQYRFVLSGGTLKVTADAAITGLTEVSMPDEAVATIDVDEGATLDLSAMTFGSNTTIVKTGLGTLLLGNGHPTVLDVQAGGIAFKAGSDLGSCLQLANGATLILAGGNLAVSAIQGLDAATVCCDSACPSGKLLSSDSAELLAAILDKLSASSSTLGSFVAENGAIYFEKVHEETVFSWKNQGTISNSEAFDLAKWSYKFYPFFDSTSWVVGKSKSGTNPDGLIPGTADWLYYGDDYGPIVAVDMGGRTGTIGGYDSGFTTLEPWGFRGTLVKNGTLRISQCFSGTRFTAHAIDGGTILHDTTAVTQTGRGDAQSCWVAENGGTIDLKGEISFVSMQSLCKAGGTFNLDLDVFAMHKDCTGSRPETYFKNYGTFNMPHGLALTGTGTSSSWGRVHLYQYDGVMSLGGNMSVATSVYGNIFLHLHGGTLKITDDVAFSRIHYLGVEEGCTVTLDVDEDKTVNFASLDLGLQFGADAKLVKTGPGAMTLGNTLAGQLEVQGGTVRCQQTALGDNLTLAEGGTLVLTGNGVSATSIQGLDVGSVVIADTIKYGKVFTSGNAETLDAVLANLAASVAPEDSLFKVGDSIYFESAHPSTVFSWVPVWAYLDGIGYWYKSENLDRVVNLTHFSYLSGSSWSLGRTRTGGNPDGVIPQADDDIYIDDTYEPLFAMDLKGQARTLRNYDKTGYAEKWGFNGFSIKNGSLEFTGTFKSTRGYLFASAGGKLIFGPTSTSVFGSGGAECKSFVYDSGEIVYRGDVTFSAMITTIYSGGKVTIDPNDGILKMPNSDYYTLGIDNAGTLSLPQGLTLSGSGHPNKVFTIVNRAGSTLELGGPLVRSSTLQGTYSFQLEDGSLTVTENAAITGFNSVTMADDASVEIDIAEGKTLDLTSMTFGSNTTVTNTGKGRIRFGASRPTTYINPNVQPAMIILW